MSGYALSEALAAVDASFKASIRAGVVMHTAEEGAHAGRHVRIEGADLLNFGDCSYLGLDQREELKAGAIDAVRRYGTQLAYSRAYLDSPLYARLERALDRMTGGHTLVTTSTTLGHVAALPILVRPGDAAIIDRSTHASVHLATKLVETSRVDLSQARHGDLAFVASEVARLSATHERVWYLLDGLYSMFGDLAPMGELARLLAEHPRLHLYVDDAHATSWLGEHGRGAALASLPDTRRVVVALSLNKAFAASGGALVFPDPHLRDLVRRCGAPLIFGGPIPPPMLGAAVASAELHLTPELDDLQRALRDRIRLVRTLASDLGVTFVSDAESPIFFVHCGASEAMYRLTRSLRARGVFVCPSDFPAVARGRAGIRFSVSLHNTEEDIHLMMRELASQLAALDLLADDSTPSATRSTSPRQ